MGVDPAACRAIDDAVFAEMTKARDDARAAPWPGPETALEDVQDAGAPQWR
jgi:hypothetical protein